MKDDKRATDTKEIETTDQGENLQQEDVVKTETPTNESGEQAPASPDASAESAELPEQKKEAPSTEFKDTPTVSSDHKEEDKSIITNVPGATGTFVEADESKEADAVTSETDPSGSEINTSEEAIAPAAGEEKAPESQEHLTAQRLIESHAAEELKAKSTEEVQEDDAHDEGDENPYQHIAIDKAGSKKDLLEIMKVIFPEENIRLIDGMFKEIKSAYDHFFEPEKEKALSEFLAIEGNAEMDFDYNGDDTDQEFFALYDQLRHRRTAYFRRLEGEKEANLERKTQILDQLRALVDGEDQTSFDKVKILQVEWKKIGPVPGAQNKTLWANYNALMDRYYDQRSIYFELKDLDRKKNLNQKIELCERAEKLNPEKDLKGSIVQLNELHEEFKHLGPVPREDQEPLWQRFKAASDRVYESRRKLNEHLKVEFDQNLVKKEALINRLKPFVVFDSDRIKEWNAKTKELLAIQKEWEAIGSVPRDKARDINKSFWGSFKKFFNRKNQFFKKLDAQRVENLDKKKLLVEKAAELRDNKDWNQAADALKKLQADWKAIGPVPEKFGKSVYEEFKAHCDHFFQEKRKQTGEQNKAFDDNLQIKNELLEKLEQAAVADPMVLDDIYNLLDDYAEVGMVPRGAVNRTHDRYDRVAAQVVSHEALSDHERNELQVQFQLSKLRGTPHGDRKLNRKENALKRKIQGIENDLYNWKRNMEFFGRSNKANVLKEQMEEKIKHSEEELLNLKEQLKLLKKG